jgi:hypothetical protein
MSRTLFRICVTVVVACVVYSTLQAAMKVKTQRDRTFDFTKISTWQWNDGEPGRVIMARTADDDPEAVREQSRSFWTRSPPGWRDAAFSVAPPPTFGPPTICS